MSKIAHLEDDIIKQRFGHEVPCAALRRLATLANEAVIRYQNEAATGQPHSFAVACNSHMNGKRQQKLLTESKVSLEDDSVLVVSMMNRPLT